MSSINVTHKTGIFTKCTTPSSKECVYPFLRCFLWPECSCCHLCLLKSYLFFTPGLKGCLPWSLFGPISQNYFLPLCPQAVFRCLSFIVFIIFHDVYNYLSTYVFAFLSDTSQKTRTIPRQEINIWSLNEGKPKKVSTIHVHIQVCHK